jgi:hypothetical protein
MDQQQEATTTIERVSMDAAWWPKPVWQIRMILSDWRAASGSRNPRPCCPIMRIG